MHFTRFIWLYFLISALVIIPGVFSLVKWGLRPSIDFTGGAILEIKTSPVDKSKIEEIIGKNEEGLLNSVISTGKDTYLLKLKPIDQNKKDEIIKNLEKEAGKIEELRFETVGPILGRELINKTILASTLAASFILFYLTYQFKNRRFGICATLATLHDSLVILGIFSLLGHFKGVEVDTLFVTAILTSLSFSVHDTVVVYDRIRETLKKNPQTNFEAVVNKAITETMGRSVNNSLTIIFMLLCLWLLGGESTKWFVFTLLVGTISGTYSSPFVATPLLVVWKKLADRKK